MNICTTYLHLHHNKNKTLQGQTSTQTYPCVEVLLESRMLILVLRDAYNDITSGILS